MHRWFSMALVFGIGPIGMVLGWPADEPKFAEVVKENFSKWAGANGRELTPEQVGRLIVDPRIKGPEAAALATIHRTFGSGKKKAAVSEHLLLSGEEAKKLQSSYLGDSHHIAKAPRELFADGAPNLEGLHQGRLGDCFIVSAIGADVARSSAAFRKLFQPRPDGSIEVHFPGHNPPVHLARLTDAEIALGSTAQQQGLWLNVLEKAAGVVREKSTKNKKPDPEAIDFIAHGGDANFSIQLLSGHHAEYFSFHGTGKHAQKNPVAHAEEILIACTQHHRLMCAGTGSKRKLPPGIAKDHDYGVLGYDHAHRMVEVWNPWGNKFKPKGEPGLEHGYETEGGRFRIPLNEFLEVYGGIFYETDKPIKH